MVLLRSSGVSLLTITRLDDISLLCVDGLGDGLLFVVGHCVVLSSGFLLVCLRRLALGKEEKKK